MQFNPDKCEVLRITRKRSPTIYPYTLHKTPLRSTDNAKYLGVTISRDLNWSNHISNICSKAKNTLRFIKRNVKTNNPKVKESAYMTYVRPQLEYCSAVWHPWQKNLSHTVDSVQRSAARYVLNYYSPYSSVSNMLHLLNWDTLASRRIHSSLILLYKIHHQLVYVDHNHLIPSRNLNFITPYSRTQYHINSFFPRTIRYWNSLPTDIKSCSSLDAFKQGLSTVNFM